MAMRQTIPGLAAILLIILTMLVASTATAQEVLTLKDGTTLVGRIEKELGGKIIFRTTGGAVIQIFASDVKAIKRSSGGVTSRRYLYDDPNHTRLLWMPTGRTLKAGGGYFADYYVFFPTLAYAVTDRFTLYGAMSLIPGVRLDDQLFFFAPKVGIVQEKKFALAVGGMIIAVPDDDATPGIIYGVSTWGTKDTSLTVGAGWGWIRDESEWEIMDKPAIVLGGEHRVSSGVKLLMENWWFPYEDAKDHPVLSLGIRFFGRHLAADLGFIYVVGVDLEGFPFIPWVDFAYNF